MKKNQIIQQVEITDISSEGLAIGRANDMVVFVKGAVPGDVVDVEITRKKSNYREGKAIVFHTLSDKRTEPVCQHFGLCGGCKWQNMKYAEQLYFKHKQVDQTLRRLAKVDLPETEPILGSPNDYFYRNKMDYAFANKQWLTTEEMQENIPFAPALGFHVPKYFDRILDIKKCWLQPEPSNEIRLAIKDFTTANGYTYFDARHKEGFMRNLLIRTTISGEVMVIVVFYYRDEEKIEALMSHLKELFPQITSLNYIVNEKANDTIYDQDVIVYNGLPYITEQMEGLRFKVGPKSFYQTNPIQAQNLYNVTLEFAGLKGGETVYDLYTGTGTIACFLAKTAAKVVGVEYVPEAIEDAHINADMNNLTNTAFYAGDMKDVLNDEFIAANGKPDVIVTDPPRAGMHEDVVKKIVEIGAKRVVYVSCNPATQARDLALMDEKYKVIRVKPVDMFPHTQHVENVVLLEIRGQ
ncbi:MAG: 23S rRNA (uracil(1939)-C(5))-methyltransferase RlmD [Sphingobacteriales bacterium JAD_PAG50586_3]|nr:MAG: 23S rRNA (uracil(1939)-C(5))-methyltransferase RlmD [Sphingobacteriales bacterium JAD_PAG50586_3]